MLERHPLFTVSALAASDRSQGKPYADACAWKLAGEMPRAVRELPVEPPRPPLDCDVVFSSLPADVGREAEGCFAAEGYPVISNTSSYRMDAGVPLLVPEVNAAHLALLDGRDGGFIVTRSEEHTSELQSPCNLVCRLLLEKKKKKKQQALHDKVLTLDHHGDT